MTSLASLIRPVREEIAGAHRRKCVCYKPQRQFTKTPTDPACIARRARLLAALRKVVEGWHIANSHMPGAVWCQIHCERERTEALSLIEKAG